MPEFRILRLTFCEFFPSITSVKDKWPLILTIFFVDILQILRFKFLKIRMLVWFILMFYVPVNSYRHVVACKLHTFTHGHFPSWEDFDTCTFTDMPIHVLSYRLQWDVK